MKKILTFLLLMLINNVHIQAQDLVYDYPVANEFNSAELNITKITVSDKQTIVDLQVINQLEEGGWFCASSDIYIESQNTGERVYLINSKNIPTCPDRYNFKMKGEKLSFSLVFPSIKYWEGRINLIENCTDYCFYFKGIILDNKLSSDIRLFELALEQYEGGNFSAAYKNFTYLVSNIPNNPTMVYAFSFSYLYKIEKEKGNLSKAESWKEKFLNSQLPNKNVYLKSFE
jgi:hypothetical protein